MKFTNTLKISNKHIKIDKANQQVVIAISVTVAIVVFCLVSAQALIKQMKYQQLVLNKRNEANKMLEQNYKKAQPLAVAYAAFDGAPESILGNADKNGKIILDALPSKYDYPATVLYMEDLIAQSGVKSEGFSGIDEEATAVQTSNNPQPIEIPANFSGTGNLESVKKLVDVLYRSVRPIKIKAVSITGSESAMNIDITAITYYQPEKDYAVKDVVIKQESSSTKKKPTTSTSTAEVKK